MNAETRLAQRLADAIADGEYRPGEWLKQVDLAAAFGVTRFEVRRALEELALRKSVSHVPQKGYRVSVISETELNHCKAVRVMLETQASRLLIGRIKDEDIALLADLANRFSRAVENGTPVERSQTNHLFHDTMYAIAGNPILSELIKETRDRSRGTPVHLWPSVQSMRQSAKDHEDIVRAVKSRDEDAVVRAVRAHILKEGG